MCSAKRLFDISCALSCLVILAPLMAAIGLAVRLSSPGPAVFRQTRVGQAGRLFELYKFRTMRCDAPSETPTHLLAGANDYVTPIGRALRWSSLDELPQFVNILLGDMSVVGPRPALWNQYDLLRERDKSGASAIRPGLTGWAQVNGRDELSVMEKAALDAEYVERMSFLFDLKCITLTAAQVIRGTGVCDGAEEDDTNG